jgi:hypothetical protein
MIPSIFTAGLSGLAPMAVVEVASKVSPERIFLVLKKESSTETLPGCVKPEAYLVRHITTYAPISFSLSFLITQQKLVILSGETSAVDCRVLNGIPDTTCCGPGSPAQTPSVNEHIDSASNQLITLIRHIVHPLFRQIALNYQLHDNLITRRTPALGGIRAAEPILP